MNIADFFDKKILDKYNTTGPRYTSYPTAVAFHPQFTQNEFCANLEKAINNDPNQKLSLYLHIPFCHSLCYYCGCNKIVTRNQDKVQQYIDYLKKEIHLRADKFKGLCVNNIHFGGGTPSFLSALQMRDILLEINKHFTIDNNIKQSIEIDPREISLSYIDELYELGFNRLSIGVQDVNRSVQEKIKRVQSTSFIKQIIKRAKTLGFNSVNIDLIYGLPGQNSETLNETLSQVELMNPDRISLFSYAHMPQLFPAQRKIKEQWMPSSESKFTLFRQSINTLVDQGYHFIGMDHFAKETDELSVAAKGNKLSRNFQGYTDSQADMLLGLGVSSISNFGTAYSQNVKKLGDYYRALDGKLPLIDKGVELSNDDVIHRAIINQLMCNFFVDKSVFGANYKIEFDDYFAKNLEQLAPFIQDKLVSNTRDYIKIHDRGRLLVRNISMNFDQYLQTPAHQMRYSRVI